MTEAKPGWAIEPIADPLGAGPFVRPIALKFNGWTVKTFHSQADAELWLSVNSGPRCRCSLPEQSCQNCRAAAARNEEYLKESGIK